MFDQISEFFRAAAQIVPRFSVVNGKEGGVAWVRGKPRKIPSGCLYFYWPVWTEVEWVELRRRTMNLATQVVMLQNKPVAVSAVVVYEVVDTLKALTEVQDYEEALQDLALYAVRNALYDVTLAKLASDEASVETSMRRELTKRVKRYGIKVHDVFLSNVSPCRTLMLLGEAAVTAVVDEE